MFHLCSHCLRLIVNVTWFLINWIINWELLIESYKRSIYKYSSSPELIVGSLSVCLIVCVSGHFTTLHLSTYRKWNRSHNDRSPRLCVSPRRRPHVTAVCPTVVCKFLYYIIILLIILSSIFISTLYYYTLLYIPDSWVIASGAAKNSCARTQWWATLQNDCRLLSLSRYNESRDPCQAGWDANVNAGNAIILAVASMNLLNGFLQYSQ